MSELNWWTASISSANSVRSSLGAWWGALGQIVQVVHESRKHGMAPHTEINQKWLAAPIELVGDCAACSHPLLGKTERWLC